MRRYPASTPVVEAIATELTASPTCARSSFVTRGSRETAYRSSSSARRTLSSTGIAALASSNSSSGAASSAPGSPLCSSDSASAPLSRARRTVAATSSSEGSAAQAYPSRPPAITRTPTPRDSANVIPSTSPRSAFTSVVRLSSA